MILSLADPVATAPFSDAIAQMLSESPWWRLQGRLHPMVVHFPIALLVTAALLEILSRLRPGRPRSKAAFPCLLLGAAGALVAAWFGWVNAAGDLGAEPFGSTIFLHRWIGVAVAVFATLAVILRVASRGGWRLAARGYAVALLLSAIGVSAGGHFGAELVYGKGYVLAAFDDPVETTAVAVATTGEADPVTAASPPAIDDSSPASTDTQPIPVVATSPPAPVDTLALVQEIFDTRCVNCHGPTRQRGRLRLDDIATGRGGAWHESIVVPGNATASALIHRVTLPADDPDRMPARGKPLT
ncbi:MAG: hypothetical protein KJO43_12310, partial [Phycisphaerae bacterium]|nr:hypothetical protein [Phycisphaerae bacterium]